MKWKKNEAQNSEARIEKLADEVRSAAYKSMEALWSAFLEVGELDLFRDETIEYAKRLMAAHVPVELHVLTGLTHTFDTFPLPIADKAFEYRSYVISQL